MAFATTLGIADAALARDCAPDFASTGADVAERLNASSDRNSALITEARQYMASNPDDVCTRYYFGRYLTRLDDFDGARASLEDLEPKLAADGSTNVSPLNVVGFGHLSQGNNDSALDAFQKAADVPYFEGLPTALKTKILNNLGFTLMQLGRYDEARKALTVAAELGSSVAMRNLAAVSSIVSTLEETADGQPGTFAAIVGSARSLDAAGGEVQRIAGILGVSPTVLSVFRMQNGIYSIAIGGYNSYPTAVEDQNAAMDAGIDDSYVGWLADWVPVDPSRKK